MNGQARRVALTPLPPLPQGGRGGTRCRAQRRAPLRPSLAALVARHFLKTPSLRSDKGTSLEFTVCEARTLFRPHPQPLSHCVGEGRRAQCFWSAEAPASAWAEASLPHSIIPLSRPAGEGDKGGEGNTARLPVHARAGKNSPRFKDFVPNRCTLTRPYGGCHPLTFATPHGGEPDRSRLNAWFSASRRCRISRRASGETVKRV